MARRGWWVAAILLLIGAALWLRRSAAGPVTPPTPPAPPIVAPSPNPPPPAPKDPPMNPPPTPPTPPQDAKTGRLRVSIESATGDFNGVLAVLGADGRRLDQQKVFGDAAEKFDFDHLPPGPCRVAFVPTRRGAASWSDAVVPEQGEGAATLRLPASAQLHGKAVDALQRPLPDVTVTVALPGLLGNFPPQAPHSILFGTWNIGVSGPSVSGVVSSGGYSLTSDGVLQLSATSAKDGSFTLSGLPATPVQVEVSYQKLRYTQAFATDVDVTLVVPVQPTAPTPDPAREEFRRSADVLLKQMVEHPEAGDAYWDQLKKLLRDWMSRPGASTVDRQAVEDAIRETDKRRAESKK